MTAIEINAVVIKNFMGITDTTLYVPKSGVIQVVGRNLDSTSLTSNGTGKTTIFLAIIQGLFNKVPEMDLESVNNLITKEPYLIEVAIEVGSDEYVIVNDRNTLSMTVIKNHKIVATKIRECLRYIEHKILGVSYSEFLLLTRVTTGSIKSLFNVTSSNLLLKLFNLHELDKYEKKLKLERTQLTSQIRKISQQINNTSRPLVDKDKLELENSELSTLIARLVNENEVLENKEKSLRSQYGVLSDRHSAMLGDNCKCCGQSLPLPADTSKSTEELASELSLLDNQIQHLSLDRSNNSLLVSDHNLRINRNNTRILVAQEFIEHDLQELKVEQSTLKELLKQVEEALGIITRGEIHQHFLSQFLNTLNGLLKDANTEHYIVAYLDKTSIRYRLKTDGVPKSVKQLSGGEATVIGLTILSSIFKTINKLVGKNINLLVLDEAIHATDSVSEETISTIIKSISNKAIYVIQHHDEIPLSTFTDTLFVEKLDSETRIVDGF